MEGICSSRVLLAARVALLAAAALTTTAGCIRPAARPEPQPVVAASAEPAELPGAIVPAEPTGSASESAPEPMEGAPPPAEPTVLQEDDAPAAPPLRHPFHEELPVVSAEAKGFANLSPQACQKELRARRIAVQPAGRAAGGIATPVRLGGPLRGVRFVAPGAKTPYGVLDCRLALALDELAEVLVSFDVVEVRVDNMYRPRARIAGRRRVQSQHAHGLAADVVSVKLRDGSTLSVAQSWGSAEGSAPCGPGAPGVGLDEDAVRLRSIFCAIARRGIFHHVLTPSYDAAHRDHVHLDLKRGASRLVVR